MVDDIYSLYDNKQRQWSDKDNNIWLKYFNVDIKKTSTKKKNYNPEIHIRDNDYGIFTKFNIITHSDCYKNIVKLINKTEDYVKQLLYELTKITLICANKENENISDIYESIYRGNFIKFDKKNTNNGTILGIPIVFSCVENTLKTRTELYNKFINKYGIVDFNILNKFLTLLAKTLSLKHEIYNRIILKDA